VRPLSARGEAMAAAMARVRHHDGPCAPSASACRAWTCFRSRSGASSRRATGAAATVPLGYSDAGRPPPLRELLCAYLKASRGVRCTPEQIVVTAGSQQALYLLAQLLLAPGEGVWLESPGYQGALAPFAVAGARICPVPVDAEGMDVPYAAARYPDARMAFATPSHQLPLGVTMSLARRLQLLRWAEAKRAWIVEDDYDSEYRYTGPPLASLQSLDRSGSVIYVGTLSKVLFPGLRLGYIVAPPALAEPLARAKAVVDRHNPIVPQAVLADFIQEGHFARHIRRTREAYGERRIAMLEAIDSRLQRRAGLRPVRCRPGFVRGSHKWLERGLKRRRAHWRGRSRRAAAVLLHESGRRPRLRDAARPAAGLFGLHAGADPRRGGAPGAGAGWVLIC
jgi:GntR family transcriptional regulator/MocR family aminotransferase